MAPVLQRGPVKLSSPSLRPRLYLSPGDKGYVGGSSGKRDGGGSKGGRATGALEGAYTLADCERQVCVSLRKTRGRRGGGEGGRRGVGMLNLGVRTPGAKGRVWGGREGGREGGCTIILGSSHVGTMIHILHGIP